MPKILTLLPNVSQKFSKSPASHYVFLPKQTSLEVTPRPRLPVVDTISSLSTPGAHVIYGLLTTLITGSERVFQVPGFDRYTVQYSRK